MKTIEPLHDYVLIERTEPSKTTEGGIVIPDSAREKHGEGVVRAAGPGAFQSSLSIRIAPSVYPGDRVIFGKYAGTEIEGNGETLLLVREGDIIAKVANVTGAVA